MIVFLTMGEHTYTHRALLSENPPVRVVPYDGIFAEERPPPASYVFTDLDRLPFPWQLKSTGLYQRLKGDQQSYLVFNDPARVKTRYGLLRALFQAGINSFNVYRCDEGSRPRRFPVFIRFEYEHGLPLSGLLPDQRALDQAIATAVAGGAPERSILIVEYRAEPLPGGVFRKYGAYRVGERIFAAESVHDTEWCVKYGKLGIAGADGYREELSMIRDYPYGETLRRAFDIANIEYGRADFGLVGGRPEIYEINTNPMIKQPSEHPSPDRVASMKLIWANYQAALRAIDSGNAGRHPG